MMMMPTDSFNAYNGLNNKLFYNPCNSQMSPRTNETWSSIAKSMGKSCMKQRKTVDVDRIVVPNVVYLMNLPQISSIEDILKSPRFLGQYGRIERIIVHKNCTAHVTFATATAAQVCIQCLNNFYFDGIRISAKVGTTKYPQDVDLDKIAQTSETEPPPPICYDPVFPPPQFGVYNAEFELSTIPQIDASDDMPNIELDETDQLGTLPICYEKSLDARHMATLISPMENLMESEGGNGDYSLCIDDLMFGTGGVHNAVWSDEFPTYSGSSQIRASFVPRLGVPLLNLTALTAINAQSKPTISQPSQISTINIQSPPPQSFSKPPSMCCDDRDRHHSPRGIDELDLWDSAPSDLNYLSAEYSYPTINTSTTALGNYINETISSPSCASSDYSNEPSFEWQGGPPEYFQKEFIQSNIPPCNFMHPEYHAVDPEHFHNYDAHPQSQSQVPFWSPLAPPFLAPYPCGNYYSPRPFDFYPNYNPYQQHIPFPEPFLPSWENPNVFS